MARARPGFFALNGGEVDSETISRTDIESYVNKAETLENFLPAVKGALRRPPGTRFIDNTRNDLFAVLRPWRYRRGQDFVIEFTERRIRLIRDDDDAPAFVETGAGTATLGSWSDGSTDGGSISAASPTWDTDPYVSSLGSTNKPLILTTPEGGIARATLTASSASANTATAIGIAVSRNWVDVRIGMVSGEGDLTYAKYGKQALRLEPGYHVLTVTPTGTTFYIDARAAEPGVRAILGMDVLGSGDLVLPSPWFESELRSLRLEQSGDVRWIRHRRTAPLALVRRANDSWSLIGWKSDDGPFLPPNTDSITMTPSARLGEITITASQDFFQSGHVGGLMQIAHVGQVESATVNAADEWTDWIRVSGVSTGQSISSRIFSIVGAASGFTGTWRLQRSIGTDANPEDVASASWTGNFTGTYDDELDNSIVYYRAGIKAGEYTAGSVAITLTYANGETIGVARIVDYTSATQVTADVLSNFGAVTASRDWSEGAWSSVRGWPAAVTLQDGRLFEGRDLSVWGSAPDNFVSFPSGAEDDDGIARDLGVGDISPIVWLKGGRQLQIGTESGEPLVRSSAFDEPLTPDNMTVRENSSRGSANVDALRVAGNVVFIAQSGLRIIRLGYDVDTQTYVPTDLTRLHEDIAGPDGGFLDIAFASEPEPRCYLVSDDGQLPVLTFAESEAVVGWARIVADGEYESVAAIPGKPEWRVYVTCLRTINGSQVRFIERFETERWTRARGGATPSDAERAACWRVHAGLVYEGAATDTLSGLDHLEGEEVVIWADGADHPARTVSGGSITLDYEVTTAIVGLEVRGRYKSPKMIAGGEGTPTVGQKGRVSHVTLLLHRTMPGTVWIGPSFDNMRPLEDREQGFTMDEAPALFSGAIRQALPGDFHSNDPRVCIEVRGAGPASILGYLPEYSTHTRP